MILVVAIAGAAAGVLAWYVVGQVIVVLTELPKYQENIHNKIQSLRSPAKGPISSITTTVRDINRELSLPDATNDLPAAFSQGICEHLERGAAPRAAMLTLSLLGNFCSTTKSFDGTPFYPSVPD